MIRLFLADDHAVVRQGLRTLLGTERDLTVVGEGSDGLRVPDIVAELAPDVLLCDVMMPGKNGIEITRQVVKRCPKVRVVILSMHADEAYVLEALRAGALGYVLKDDDASEIVAAVRHAAAGKRHLSPRLSERAIEIYAEKGAARVDDLLETLTEREREVLQLAAEGASNVDIGEKLFISPRTVEIHRANLLRKLALKGQTELVRFAIRRGIIPLDK